MKPYVICHMLASVDGRILPGRWHPSVEDRGVYERLHNELGCDAWLVGRVTGQEFAARVFPYPSYTGSSLGRENWLAHPRAGAWAVVLDAGGKIAWGRGEVGGDPLLVVLTQSVSDSHLGVQRFIQTSGCPMPWDSPPRKRSSAKRSTHGYKHRDLRASARPWVVQTAPVGSVQLQLAVALSGVLLPGCAPSVRAW